MNKHVLITALGLSTCIGTSTALAALSDGTTLAFQGGGASYFAMGSPNSQSPIQPGPDGGLIIGQAQPGGGTHGGPPNGSESPSIDQPWVFFCATGIHFTDIAPVVIDPDVNSDGGFTQTVDVSGWNVSWNGIPEIPIPMIATVVCDQADCASGSNFTLDMNSPIPPHPGHGFAGVPYFVHLEGTVIAPPLVATAVIGPQTLNVKSQGNGFSVEVALEDTDGSAVDPAGVNAGVSITSIGGNAVPAGDITENPSATSVGVNTITLTYNDPATGTRQDVIAAVSDVVDGSSVEVCVSGSAQDASGSTRDFEGCGDVTIKNKGNR